MEQDNHLLLTNTFHWKCEECPPRNSHVEFFNNRDWQSVQEFWSHALKALYQRDKNETITASSALPPFIVGDELFSWTSLNRLHMVSMDSGEFDSTDQKFSSRYTYALCIGYDGSKYNGYQQQRGTDPNQIRTVEDDVEFLLRRKVIVAGRTDKDVSAMSQIISFHNHDAADQSDSIIKLIERRMERFDSCLQSGEPYISDDEISQNDNESMTQPEQSMLSKKKSKLQDKMNKKKSSFSYSTPTSSLSGKFRVWDCQRVSRKFHPIFSTLWRRYIFLFPLCPGKYENNVDVDVDFVRRCFAR
jgi:catabolite regulation protein CreA